MTSKIYSNLKTVTSSKILYKQGIIIAKETATPTHGLFFIFFIIGKSFISGCLVNAIFIDLYFDLGGIKVILISTYKCKNVTKPFFSVMSTVNCLLSEVFLLNGHKKILYLRGLVLNLRFLLR